jgi:hypothetical protein
MRTAEDIRKEIVDGLFNKPILGENYIDWHTDDGECGLLETVNKWIGGVGFFANPNMVM